MTNEILDIIHKTIYQFFDVCEDDEEVPISDKDKLLLEVNKTICNNLKALEQQPCEDAVSREDVIEILGNYGCTNREGLLFKDIQELPPVQPKAKTGQLTNSEWIDFLTEQFDISRTSAKEMLHVMMSVKKEDNFKKQFSGRK